jgi:glyoxylase-like metal-dependent hydrolase (beta-lactamase superfamily II)
METMPGIHTFKIPIPDNPLGSTNIYFIKSTQGCLLIDVGWNSDESFQALQAQMAEAGGAWEDLRYIVLTHAHPDHSGLLDRVAEIANPELVMHSNELALLRSYVEKFNTMGKGMRAWLYANGLSLPEGAPLSAPAKNILGYTPGKLPERPVNAGDHLHLGEYDFELFWTPGHAPGHLCLFERSRELLFAGDHVLLYTTPNVSKYGPVGEPNPLDEYLKSLRKIAVLPVKLVLPAHGPAFTHLAERAAEIENHHYERAQAVCGALEGKSLTTFEISAAIPWSTNGVPWEKLPVFMQQMAMAETLAHLDYLEIEGKVTQSVSGGVVRYARLG